MRATRGRGPIERAVAGGENRAADEVIQRMEAGRKGCVRCGRTSGQFVVLRGASGSLAGYCETCDPGRRGPRRPSPDEVVRRLRLEEAERTLRTLPR